MSEIPVRVLILLDGDHVAPEKSYLNAKAQGGALVAFQLAEQCRRWISREVGKEAIINCLLFADVAHLCRSMDLPVEGIVAFSKGFSSTPTPCAFVHVLQGTTLSAINAHLAFLLPSLDYIFLGGFSTDLHAYHLTKLFQALSHTHLPRPKLILLETTSSSSSSQVVEGISKLVDSKTRFQGISIVRHNDKDHHHLDHVETNILTNPHYEIQDGHPQDSFVSSFSPTTSPSVSPIRNVVPPSPTTMSRLAVLPETSTAANPWSESPSPSPRSHSGTRTTPVSSPLQHPRQAQAQPNARGGTLSFPPGLSQPAPVRTALAQLTIDETNSTSPLPGAFPASTSSSSSQLPLQASTTPLESPRRLDIQDFSAAPILNLSPSLQVASPPASSSKSQQPSRTVPPPPSILEATSPATVSSPPSPSPTIPSSTGGGPTIPQRFLPLLRLIHKHQISNVSSNSTSATPTSSSPISIRGGESPSLSPSSGGGGNETVLWSTIGSEISSSSSSSTTTASSSSSNNNTKKKQTSSSSSTTTTTSLQVPPPPPMLPKGTKLKEFLTEAQRSGWVMIGKGQGEGMEWVKLSKRAERALSKK